MNKTPTTKQTAHTALADTAITLPLRAIGMHVIDANGMKVCEANAPQYAALLAQAMNTNPDLLEALEKAQAAITRAES